MLSIKKDLVGNIIKDGQTIHTMVRAQVDRADRVAVFLDYTQPPVVYGPGEVEYQQVRIPCSCKGDKGRQWVSRIWLNAEKAVKA